MSVSNTDLRVAELMSVDLIVVSDTALIDEAEELLRRHRMQDLPVVDIAGRLVGVISQTDLLYLDVPAVRALIRHEERGIRVGEVMSTPPSTIDSMATVKDAARRMHDEQIHRLVAVEEHGRPIGVITSMDFVALAAEG